MAVVDLYIYAGMVKVVRLMKSPNEMVFRGTVEVREALGERKKFFDEWVRDYRRDARRTYLDPAVPDHVALDVAKDFAELLPVVKCEDGRYRYVLTRPQLDKLGRAMHPPLERVGHLKLLAIKDELPQPRDPVTGRMMAWTAEMIQSGPDGCLPKGWADELGREIRVTR
jgi:hypothetical protein